jgi:hypothetical protein
MTDEGPAETVLAHYAAAGANDRDALSRIDTDLRWFDNRSARGREAVHASVRIAEVMDASGLATQAGDKVVVAIETFQGVEGEFRKMFLLRRIDGRWRVISFNSEDPADID